MYFTCKILDMGIIFSTLAGLKSSASASVFIRTSIDKLLISNSKQVPTNDFHRCTIEKEMKW